MNATTGPVRRLLPMQLNGVCPPLGELTLVSQHVTFSYTIAEITIFFGPSTDFLTRVAPLVAFDPSISVAGLPSGTPLLSWLSANPYLVGEEYAVTIPVNMPVERRSSWLKAHIINDDAFPHTVSVVWAIEEMTPD